MKSSQRVNSLLVPIVVLSAQSGAQTPHFKDSELMPEDPEPDDDEMDDNQVED
jgi:hypothetical protein